MKYKVINKYSGEEYEVDTLREVADVTSNTVHLSTISRRIRNENKCEINDWVITKEQVNVYNISSIKDAIKVVRKNKNKRTLEGGARTILDDYELYTFIERERSKRERYKDITNGRTNSEKQRDEEWEKHIKNCCTLANDGKTYIPNSLLKEFPNLIDFGTPKCIN